MIRNTHLSGSPAAVAKYMESKLEEHLTRSGEVKATGYYSMAGGAPSEWFGKGAEAQGLSGAVAAEDMVRVLSGTVKHTGEDISTRGGQTSETRRMGEELTIAAPKSVSIMAVEDPRIVQAHQAAVRAAMKYVEQEMVHARIGKGGGKGNDFSGNLTAGLYVHEDARDSSTGRVAPHLHSHAIISNMTQRSDGKWVNLKLDWGHNNEKKMAADSVYKAELARQIKFLGYQIEKGQGANFEVAGITRDQIEYFSPRSQDIKKEIGGERDAVSPKERQAAQNKTKGNKSRLNQIDQRYEWRREFREQNMDLQSIHDRAVRRESAGIPVSQITAEDALKSAIRHLSERDSVFSEQSLKSEALSAGLGDVSPEAIDAAIKARVGGLVYAGQAEGLNDRQFTTKSAIYTEAEILHRGREGRGKAEAIYPVQDQEVQKPLEVITLNDKELRDGKRKYADDNTINNAETVGPLSVNGLRELSEQRLDANSDREDPELLYGDAGLDRSGNPDLRRASDDPRINAIIAAQEATQGFKFGDGQRSAVELALSSNDRHLGVVGSSGAGKTTSMKVIVSEYQKAGYQVIGVAPTSKAKRELEGGAGCNETVTLADALLRKPSLDESGQATQKILYVMDEAGMVSSRDFDRFYKRADLENARTLVVGDPYQIESVEAGTPFAQLLETDSISHVKIDEVQRQRAAPELLKIAQAFASGDAVKGVELAKPFMTQVNVEKGQDKDEALAKVAASRYLSMSPQERADTYFIADTNKKRQAINTHVRAGLTASGALGADAAKIIALDKLDLTKEAATKSENYVSKNGAPVIVEFHCVYEDKDLGVKTEKGSQWDLVDTAGGKLTLQDRSDPAKKLQVNPVKIAISAYSAREMELRSGDQVYFRRNDKTRDLINGTSGTVIVENGKASVKTDHGQIVPLHEGKGEVLDYSYAITTHASQGGTKHKSIPVLTAGGRGMNANLGYVAMTRETHELEVITDDIYKLCKGICKFSEKQSAMAASKTQVSPELDEIRQARRSADHELGQAGDLAEKRSPEELGQEHEEPDAGIIAEPEPLQFQVAEMEME
ncbi:MobF family relaxase [Acidithiobacillus sp.]